MQSCADGSGGFSGAGGVGPLHVGHAPPLVQVELPGSAEPLAHLAVWLRVRHPACSATPDCQAPQQLSAASPHSKSPACRPLRPDRPLHLRAPYPLRHVWLQEGVLVVACKRG